MFRYALIAVFLVVLVPVCLWASIDWALKEGEQVTVSTSNLVLEGTVKRSDTESVDISDPRTGAVTTVRLSAVQTITRGGALRRNLTIGAAAPLSQSLARKHVVYIHGICQHPAHYSDAWWQAMTDYLPALPDSNHHEVLWSDLVYPAASAMRAQPINPAQSDLSQSIKDVIEDRLQRQVMDVSAAPETQMRAQDLRGLRDAFCVDDFMQYLLNRNLRDKIIKRFTDVVLPLLKSGEDVEVISHSWGTVVAYDGLCLIEKMPSSPGSVRNFFTVGSALSFPEVRRRLDSTDGHRPIIVARWVNLNARFDVIGGHLQGNPFKVDDEYLQLTPVGCSSYFPEPVCAHSSYFQRGNSAVNRDIFVRWLVAD
jgi:hypothetical protein